MAQVVAWGPSQTRSISIPGSSTDTQARVIQCGQGYGVVFLHGLVGLNDHWRKVIGRISDGIQSTLFELPLLDLKGADCSIQGVTDLTIAFLEEHVKTPTILVGNSFGGHVALRIAHLRPDLVRGLVLAGSSGLFERTLVRGAPVRPSKAWVAEKIAELFYDKSALDECDIDRAHQVLNTKQGARAMVRLSRTARRDHLGDVLSEIETPTLLIWGREDIVTPPSAAQGFHDLMPNTQLVWVEHCGHTPMLEAPQVFSDALLAFADRVYDKHGA